MVICTSKGESVNHILMMVKYKKKNNITELIVYKNKSKRGREQHKVKHKNDNNEPSFYYK